MKRIKHDAIVMLGLVVIFVVTALLCVIEVQRQRAQRTQEEEPTHRECQWCGEWDYSKNLREEPLYLKDGPIYLVSPYPPFPTLSEFRLLSRYTNYAHAACSRLERCDCVDGWRIKEPEVVETPAITPSRHWWSRRK